MTNTKHTLEMGAVRSPVYARALRPLRVVRASKMEKPPTGFTETKKHNERSRTVCSRNANIALLQPLAPCLHDFMPVNSSPTYHYILTKMAPKSPTRSTRLRVFDTFVPHNRICVHSERGQRTSLQDCQGRQLVEDSGRQGGEAVQFDVPEGG